MPLDSTRPVLHTVGNYDLVEKIAEGGMGAVYRARQRDTGAIVAVKILAAHMASNSVLVKRFEQEFRAASRLDHPNIVRALEYGEHANAPYMVMEFVNGESLGHKIQREGRLAETDAIRIIAQVAQGLHRAHKLGLVHRDVKPDNILVTPDGTAKLADLGLVKELDTDLNLTRTGRGLGTPHFMAPEQFRDAKNADLRCDIYGLGATLYQMVTGELPFRSNGPLDAWMKKMHNDLSPPRLLVPGLSERLDWAIRRAMSADPEQRPITCREFVEDLTGRSTRKHATTESNALPQDLWYLVYKDEEGEMHTVKGSVGAIRRSLRDGLLGDASNVRASRFKTGPFEPLRGYPEFRDLVITPAPLTLPRSSPPSPSPSTSPAELQTPENAPTVIAQPALPQSTSPPVENGQEVPHIQLGAPQAGEWDMLEWLKWIVLAAIAIITAILAYYYLPLN